MNGESWWVTLVAALIVAGPPTVAGLVLLRRLGVVHVAVNSTHAQTVQELKEARQEIADLREQLGARKEQRTP